MRYLLDTNTCINHLRSRGRSTLGRRLAGVAGSHVALCSIVKAELIYGAHRSADPMTNLSEVKAFVGPFTSLPFDDAAAQVYGRVRSLLASAGTPIGPNDLLIASIALANDLTLITHNVAEFSRVSGLKIADWETTT